MKYYYCYDDDDDLDLDTSEDGDYRRLILNNEFPSYSSDDEKNK